MMVNVITNQVAFIYLASLIPIVQAERLVVARSVTLAQVVSVSSVRLFQVALLDRVVVTIHRPKQLQLHWFFLHYRL